MRKLIAFNSVSLDGYFTDASGDMSWAHKHDAEWNAFVKGNASGGGTLLFGRKTYELMAGYWPTPMAMKNDPVVAAGMNKLPKVVFSRTLDKAAWSNTTLVKDDLLAAVRKMKNEPEGPEGGAGDGLVILGSGSIVSQLAQARLIDVFQIALNPVVLGRGRTLFEGVQYKWNLKLTNSRAFQNGNVFLSYEPAM
jgi:dihydrofolate reductase